METKRILGASLGNCVHVAGVLSFLETARRNGWDAKFAGAALPPADFVAKAIELKPDVLAVSYRLSPEPLRALLADLKQQLDRAGLPGRRLVFGGTPQVSGVARESGLFEAVFDGTEGRLAPAAWLRGEAIGGDAQHLGDTLLERIETKRPFPILRHHFGQPTLQATIDGATEIAESGVLDVFSIGPDQNAQQHFFHPDDMDSSLDGAGGVPLRTPEDLKALFEATRRGNYPLLRCYSGTRDLIRWAEVHVATIHNAWGAVPLCWYNVLDARSERPLEEAIAENQQAIAWYGARGIPLECNESHHWSLRSAHDPIAVVMAFLAAYNARQLGVSHYVAQYMFNTPAGTSFKMDLAKMLAKIELIESLHSSSFTTIRETRAGLMFFLPDLDQAKGQLAASTVLQLQMKPSIMHVVGFSEADHAVLPHELVESCRLVQGVLEDCLEGLPDMTLDPEVQARKAELLAEAALLLAALKSRSCGCGDSWTCPRCITSAIKTGLLDAPHLCGNPAAAGKLVTAVLGGAVRAIDERTGQPLTEAQRLATLGVL